MTIDNVVVSKQVNISAEKGTIDLRVQATDISAEDAIRANALFDRFVGEMSGQRPITKHMAVVSWGDDEKAVVLAAKTSDEAWEKYQGAFPDSKRKSSTVRRWWKNNQSHLKIEDDPKPAGKTRHKPATSDGSNPPLQRCATLRKVAKKPKKTTGTGKSINKWQIPFNTTTQKKEYQRAWLLCRTYNLPYPEALKKDQEKKSDTCKIPESGEGARPEDIKVTDLKITEEPVTPGPRPYPAPQAVKLVRGMQVRYVGSHPKVAFQGSREVKKVNELSGEALVDIGKGIEWIPTRDLAVAV